MTELQNRPFQTAARRAVRRLVLVRWVASLSRTAVYLLPAVLLAAAIIWLAGGRAAQVAWAGMAIPTWLLGTAFWAWWRRPNEVTALAQWDDYAKRGEMFTSALCFEEEGELGVGEQLHVLRALKRLHRDGSKLRRDLPVQFSHRTWLFPSTSAAILAGLVAVLIVTQPALPKESRIADDEIDRAKEIAEKIDEQKELVSENDALTEEEKEEIKELEQALEETAQKLRELEQDEERRDVLAELEQRAHEAELLAQALGAAEGDELSSEMLKELSRHVDTTDLANALMANDLENTAEEAEGLAKRLEQKDLTIEEHERIELALKKSLDKATPTDLQTAEGKNFDEAHLQLKKDQRDKAAEEFRKIAERSKRSAQRQLAQKQLQELAKQLRASGQKIFGQRTPGIQQLAQQNSNGLRSLSKNRQGKPLQLALNRNMGQRQPNSNAPLSSVPFSNAPMANMPMNSMPSNMPPVPGNCQNPGQNPSMFASIPIPGQCQGGQCLGGQMPGGQCAGGNCPIPGTQPGPGGGNGGLMAGNSPAAYADATTNPLAAANTDTVNAPITGDGESEMRTIEGGEHREETARNMQTVAMNQLMLEEEALAEEPLPLSRREQVLRYFTALRSQLVESESAE